MTIMEGNCLSEYPPPPPPSAEIGCSDEFNRSNSDASTLTAENCEDILHRSANVKPDDSTMWTNEKHSLYLEHLEVSFIKQLHQSIGLLAQCSDQKSDEVITRMHPINVDNDSEEFTTMPHGCSEKKISCNKGNRLSHVSPDTLAPIKSPLVRRSKRIGMHHPAASPNFPELLRLCDTENHRKVNTSHGLDTCSQKFPPSGQYHGDTHHMMTEGTGQNFVEDANQTKSNTECQVKRLKRA